MSIYSSNGRNKNVPPQLHGVYLFILTYYAYHRLNNWYDGKHSNKTKN